MRNYKKVTALFEQTAVLIGNKDVVPSVLAEELFGEDAVKFAFYCGGNEALGSAYNGIYFLSDKFGGYNCKFLTRKGFFTAATFDNVREVQKVEDERNAGN